MFRWIRGRKSFAIAFDKRQNAVAPPNRHQSLDDFREELQHCYGSISFRRHQKGLGSANDRAKRLTDDLDEWLNKGSGGLSLDEARRLALADAATEFHDDPTRPDLRKEDE